MKRGNQTSSLLIYLSTLWPHCDLNKVLQLIRNYKTFLFIWVAFVSPLIWLHLHVIYICKSQIEQIIGATLHSKCLSHFGLLVQLGSVVEYPLVPQAGLHKVRYPGNGFISQSQIWQLIHSFICSEFSLSSPW